MARHLLVSVVVAFVMVGATSAHAAQLSPQCAPVAFGTEGLALEISVANLGRYYLALEENRSNSITIEVPGSDRTLRATARAGGGFADVEFWTSSAEGRISRKAGAAPSEWIASYTLSAQEADREPLVLEELETLGRKVEMRVISSSGVIAQGCCQVGDTICCPDAGTCVRCNGTSTCCTVAPK